MFDVKTRLVYVSRGGSGEDSPTPIATGIDGDNLKTYETRSLKRQGNGRFNFNRS